MTDSFPVKRGLQMISKNHKKYLTILLINILIFLSLSCICSADTILARGNRKELKLSGKIIELRKGKVSILGEDGKITNVNWDNIVSITIGDQVFVTLATEERVFGSLKLENGQVIINSASMGIIKSDQAKIVAIERKKQEVSPSLAILPQEMSAKTGAEMPPASHQKPLGENLAKAGKEQQSSRPLSKEVVAQPFPSPAPTLLNSAELEDTVIEVWNGTRAKNLAHQTQSLLRQEGFWVAKIGNYVDFGATKTMIYYRPGAERVARELARKVFPGAGLETSMELKKDIDIRILLGADLLERPQLMTRPENGSPPASPFSETPPATDELMATVRGKGDQSAPSAEGTQEENKEEGKKETEKATEAGKKPTTIGEQEEKHVDETFVRDEKVVLPQGKLDTELNVSYIDNSHLNYLGARDRTLDFPVTLRYGITNKLLGLVTVPVAIGWAEIPGETKTTIHQTAGLGDISFGLQYQVLTERVIRPDVALFLLAGSDTGKGGYLLPITLTPLGTGFWQINPGISFVKTVDPVVLFGSLSYTHFFDRAGFQPGEAINPVLGTGFAINDETAISFKLAGSFMTWPRFHGDYFGSLLTPFSFYFTVDKYITNNSYLEPVVGIGLTSDAPNFSFGLTYVCRWF